ncbi:MAG: hypothetical protein IPP33_10485 [Flavobacteriales bacterium]|nr:hypothetical protein [Flavobacteriales bacterium]
MRIAITFLALSFIASVSFAAPCDHVKGTGNVEKKSLTVQSFNGIAMEGSMDVVLTRGPTQSVVIEARRTLLHW